MKLEHRIEEKLIAQEIGPGIASLLINEYLAVILAEHIVLKHAEAISRAETRWLYRIRDPDRVNKKIPPPTGFIQVRDHLEFCTGMTCICGAFARSDHDQ